MGAQLEPQFIVNWVRAELEAGRIPLAGGGE